VKSRVCLLLLVLSLPAWGGQIPVGELRYLGDTPDGHGVFKVTLNPPAGMDLMKFAHTIYIGEPTANIPGGITFVLPPPVHSGQIPPTHESLFLTGYGQFANCPCTSAAYVLYAQPKITISHEGKTYSVRLVSATFLNPLPARDSIATQQATTIYLYIDDN
jgi:hypothetical protein